MKAARNITVLILILIFLGLSQNVFSWGLFNIFTDRSFSREGLRDVERFDPDKDIVYLPRLDDKDIFAAMDDLSICRKKEVRKYIYIYLTSGRNFVKESIYRSHNYLDIIHDIFNKNKDIPEDIALLPLLESGFNPHAISRSRAVGLWQFLKSTSHVLGLRKDRWIDERKDIEKSTEAAIQHLRNLYKMFNSWEFALAAYNGGAVHVRNAVKSSGTTDFWELLESGALHQETSEYVPRFIALVLIYKNQRLFGIDNELITPEKEETENYILKYPTHLDDIAEISGLSRKEIREYNPELKKRVVPPYYRNYTLRVPVKAKEKLEENEKKLYKNKFTRIRKHKVQNGECLSAIAQKYKKKFHTS